MNFGKFLRKIYVDDMKFLSNRYSSKEVRLPIVFLLLNAAYMKKALALTSKTFGKHNIDFRKSTFYNVTGYNASRFSLKRN